MNPSLNIEMDEKYFRDNVLPLKDKLFRIALRITFDRAESEDIVQDTLIRVWEHRDEWSEINSIEAYSITICRNLANDRSQKVESHNVELTAEISERSDAANMDERMIRDERLDIIQRLMKQLPSPQKEIMELRDIEGMSYKDISKILNFSEEQVKVYLFRARQKIKKSFTNIDEYGL
jgi:RNA polymerase sigma-70 factor, ECF subfamily